MPFENFSSHLTIRFFPLHRRLNIVNEATSPYSLTAISSKSAKLLRSPQKATRKISKLPFKVLDAPELADDFYLNLVSLKLAN